MPSIKTIMNILALGSVMVDNPLPQRIVSKALCMVAMVLLSALMAGVLLVVIFACIYQALISNGVPDMEAALYTLAGVFIVTAAVVGTTIYMAKHFLHVVRTHSKTPVPLTTHLSTRATGIAEAFVRGLFEHKNQYNNSARFADR